MCAKAHVLAAQGISAYQAPPVTLRVCCRKLVIYMCAKAHVLAAQGFVRARWRVGAANEAERRNPEKPGLPLAADAPEVKT